MADIMEKGELGRLEDFIAFAKEGNQVQLSVSLRKQIVTQKVHPDLTGEKKGEIDMYLLIADYSSKIGAEVKTVSKIYASGTVGEPLNATKQNINIANARIHMDYMRLREVDIIFDEEFF